MNGFNLTISPFFAWSGYCTFSLMCCVCWIVPQRQCANESTLYKCQFLTKNTWHVSTKRWKPRHISLLSKCANIKEWSTGILHHASPRHESRNAIIRHKERPQFSYYLRTQTCLNKINSVARQHLLLLTAIQNKQDHTDLQNINKFNSFIRLW